MDDVLAERFHSQISFFVNNHSKQKKKRQFFLLLTLLLFLFSVVRYRSIDDEASASSVAPVLFENKDTTHFPFDLIV